MDLRNWEFNTLGSAVVGADVYVYEATTSHPNPNSVLSSTTTNSDGMWSFAGLTDTPKDVKVVYQSKTKWYKGLVRVGIDQFEVNSLGALYGAPGVQNIAVNGNYDHWQRAGGSSVTSTTTWNRLTSFAADRNFTLPAGASVTQQRSTTVPDSNSRYSVLITGATSVTTVDHGQRFRVDAVLDRLKQPVVVSWKVQNNSGADFTPTIRANTPNSADVFSATTNRLAANLQVCTNGAWTRVWAAIDPSAYTNIDNGLELLIRIPSGSLDGAGKSVRISQFDVRPGTWLVPFVAPDPDAELARCQQYAEVLGGTDAFEAIATGWTFSTSAAYLVGKFSRKWRAPNISISANSDFLLVNSNGTGGQTVTGLTPTNPGLYSWIANNVTVSGTPFTAGAGTHLLTNNTLNARCYILAEPE